MNPGSSEISWMAANLPDLLVVGLVILSALFASFRGFVRETLAIAGWVAAAFATIWALPEVRPYIFEWIQIRWLADLLGGASIFISTLIIFWLMIHYIVSKVKNSPLNSLDRSLGLIFGFARGIFVIVLLYMVASQAVWREEEGKPTWLLQSRSLPVIDYTANLILLLVPEGTFNLPVEGFQRMQSQAKELEETREQLEQFRLLADPPLEQLQNTDEETGYNEGQTRQMDRLIETLPPETARESE